MKSNRILLIIMLILPIQLYAQHNKIWLQDANKSLRKKDYTEATRLYQRVSSDETIWGGYAHFGLGNVFAEQKKYQEALEAYQKALKQDGLSPQQVAQIHHNIGNIAMQEKKYEEAIEAYKKALILNPSDDDTRYNLVLAQKQIFQSQEKPQEEPQSSSEQASQQEQSNNSPQPNDGDTAKDDGKVSLDQAMKLLDAYRQADEQVRNKVERAQRQSQEQQSNKQPRW